MTPTEAAELQELGLTPETLKAKQHALASVIAQEKVRNAQAGGGRPMTLGEIVAAEGGIPPQTNGRKRRSDAGTKRPKPASNGAITAAQAQKLRDLIFAKDTAAANHEAAHEKLTAATDALTEAEQAVADYIDELQGKR